MKKFFYFLLALPLAFVACNDPEEPKPVVKDPVLNVTETTLDFVAEGAEGINGLMISNAAHFSSWKDETVSLPIDEDEFYNLLMKKVASSKAKEDVISVVNEDMSSTY
jgi:hypothetical protein